jgi:hypothetical protein
MPLTQPSGSVQSLPIALPLAGGTLTGPLVLAGAPTVALNPATKAYTDTADAALNAAKLNLSGGTMTGDLVLNADPTLALGAATKQFVEATAVNVANVPPLLLMAQNIY